IKLILSLPVLVVVLTMVWGGPALAQVVLDISSKLEHFPDKLKELRNALEEKSGQLWITSNRMTFLSRPKTGFPRYSTAKKKLKVTFS
uniref:Uncharacterized protein n=1 Tax=Sciurus vulgaris TaxID=55149 RepID=A0A8D2AXU7_SCIVU